MRHYFLPCLEDSEPNPDPLSPMPVRLDVDAMLRVSDRIAHENYQLQGWTVGELRPGRWGAFFAQKAERRLLIAIRDVRDVVPQADPIEPHALQVDLLQRRR